MTESTKEALEAARLAIRRGSPIGQPIKSCACFSDTRSPRNCHGVCEDAAEYIALALDAFAAQARDRALEEAAEAAVEMLAAIKALREPTEEERAASNGGK